MKKYTTFVHGEKYKMVVKVMIKSGNECHPFNLSYKSAQVEQVLSDSVLVCSSQCEFQCVDSCKFGAKMSGP